MGVPLTPRAQAIFDAGAERRARMLAEAEAKRGYSLRHTQFLATLEAVDRQFAIRTDHCETQTSGPIAVPPAVKVVVPSCPAEGKKPGNYSRKAA